MGQGRRESNPQRVTNGVDPFVFAGAAVDAFEEAMTAQ
jgi:hypothetical protein